MTNHNNPMKHLTIILTFALLSFGCGTEVPTVQALSEGDQAYAFENVNVVPMDEERVLEGQTVLVINDRIANVGPASDVNIPSGVTRIDGSGKYLMPGLAEMHGHIPPPNQSEAFIESVLFMYVANGITTVRGMLGHDGQLDIKARANAGEIVAPTLYLAGPSFNGGSIDSPEAAEAKVRQQKAEGWDLLKVHPGLTLSEFDAMANTANEIGIRFGGHVPADVGLAHAIEMGQETFDHIDGYIQYLEGESKRVSDEAIAEAVQMTIDAGAWVVPTMVLWEVLYGTAELTWVSNLPELKYMPRDMVDSWIRTHESRLANPQLDMDASEVRIENRMRLLAAMNEAGARILMGTDAPQQFSVPGFSIHEELKRMTEADMTPYEVYRTGTVAVGEYFADQDNFGTIATGQRADLMLLNDNPLEDVANIKQRAGVMVRGQWLSENDIQARLAEIARMHSAGS